jgi:tRNA-modifying protein YgfZ
MERTILAVTGADREGFLQGLVSNDLRKLATEGILYAALLTAQGKYLADFFLVAQGDSILIDVATPLADGLLRRLTLYRLRAAVQIASLDLTVTRGVGDRPVGALPDPRHPALGWRHYGTDLPIKVVDWDAIRVAHLIPETGIELGPETYILEAGFERLHGVDFRKGCYVGQEVTARMKHKTTLRKGLVGVTVQGDAAPGTPILTEDGREAGVLHTCSGNRAIAWLRLDWADAGLTAGTATVTVG